MDHLYFEICPVVFDKKVFEVFPFGCRILHGIEFFEQI